MMRSILFSLLALSLTTCTASAQEPPTPKIRAGDRALLFTLNGLSSLGAGAFAGGVGGQYYFTDGLALRLGLGLSLESTSQTPPPGDSLSPDLDSSAFGFTIIPAVRYNIGSSGPVVGYVGAQLLISSSSSTITNVSFIDGVVSTESTLSFGGGLIGGVEWFAFSGVSLGAEYQLMFTSTSGTKSLTVGGKRTDASIPPRRNLSLGRPSGANFLVAFYF